MTEYYEFFPIPYSPKDVSPTNFSSFRSTAGLCDSEKKKNTILANPFDYNTWKYQSLEILANYSKSEKNKGMDTALRSSACGVEGGVRCQGKR